MRLVPAGLSNWFAPRSLRSRVAWWATTVVAVCVMALAIGANMLLRQGLDQQTYSVLEARAEAVGSTIQLADDGTTRVRMPEDDWALEVGTWIFTPDGAVLRQPEDSSDYYNRMAGWLATQGDASLDIPGPYPIRLFSLPINKDGRLAATVVTSTSLSPTAHLATVALWSSVAIVVLLLVVVHLALRASVRRALRPVQEMTEQAGRWSADDVDRRFGASTRAAELSDLAITLDGVLDRVSAALRYEQQLTGELSHELRTPLARIRAELDLVRDRRAGDPEVAAGLPAMDAAVTDMQQIIETLLSAGRSGTRTAPGRCRPAEVVTALADAAALGHTANGQPALVNEVSEGLVVGVDEAVLRRLLAPLVDNARRYALTAIEVRGERRDGTVVLTVDDDGPGVRAHDVELVFAPGWRADPADGHLGGGLGLALTRRLATACGGSVRAVPRAGGGRFEVGLPPG